MPNRREQPSVSLDEALFLHVVAIGEFGGAGELRDRGLLEAALARPLATFDDVAMFPTPHERSAAVWEALVRNHPFVDGNKRVAVLVGAYWLEREGYRLVAENDEVVQLTLRLVQKEIDLAGFTRWLEDHSEPIALHGT